MDHVLETERLILRPFTEDDYDVILQIASDPDATKYLYFWGRDGITPRQDAHRFLNHALKEWSRDKITMREYCVILKETGERIGDASVEVCDETAAEIGWILLPAFRGKGYATEAGRAMMDFGFTRYHAQRVIAHCDTRNAPSYHVMERLGMRLEGVEKEALLGARKHLVPDGGGALPKLLVAAYHHDEDIFRLPLMLWQLQPQYKIYLRKHPYVPAWEINFFAK